MELLPHHRLQVVELERIPGQLAQSSGRIVNISS